MKIEWSLVKRKKINQDTMNNMINNCKIEKHAKTNCNSFDWLKEGTWRYDILGDYGNLYKKNRDGLIVYTTNITDDNKNNQEVEGKDAIKGLENKFKENNGVGLKIAFGTSGENFKLNIPRQFYFIKERYKNQITDGVSAVDFSSHYPSCGCGIMPDAHTMKEVDGRVKPSKEYPFAFYDSGHLAIFKEFDTHDWLIDYNFTLSILQPEVISSKTTKTYLMKASKYTLDSTWQYFYDKRKESELYKLILNASIGWFHTKTYTQRKYAHLAAVIIARANNKMLKLANYIGYNNIIQICVDGCIYKGKQSYAYGEGMGSLKQEHLNESLYIKGCNQYVFSELQNYYNCTEIKHGGFDARTDGKKLDNADYIKDIDLYYKINRDILKDPAKIIKYLGGLNE